MTPLGVLAMAYGTASGPGDIERYYTDIRGGRPPSPELLAELRARYEAIGNRFPLLDITRRQAAALESALNADEPGSFSVYLGMKHSPPFIAEGVERMRTDGIERAIGLVLAPHFSHLSVGTYIDRVEAARAGAGAPAFTYVRSWHDHPLFVGAVAARVADAFEHLEPAKREGAAVVFTAHSLPARIADEGDPYPAQLAETAELVAARMGLRQRYLTAWQSAGRTPEAWLGPDLTDVIGELASDGHSAVVACACGFVADHLEILYDLDIEARRAAEEAGIAFVRTRSMNDEPDFVQALAAVVREHVAAAASR